MGEVVEFKSKKCNTFEIPPEIFFSNLNCSDIAVMAYAYYCVDNGMENCIYSDIAKACKLDIYTISESVKRLKDKGFLPICV